MTHIGYDRVAYLLGVPVTTLKATRKNIPGFPKAIQEGVGRFYTIFEEDDIIDWMAKQPNYLELLKAEQLRQNRVKWQERKAGVIKKSRQRRSLYTDPGTEFSKRAAQFLTTPMVNPFPVKVYPNDPPITRQTVSVEEINDAEKPDSRLDLYRRGAADYCMHMNGG